MGGTNSSEIIEELREAQLTTDEDEKDEKLKKIFAKADKNNSQFLEENEAKKFFGQLYDYLTKTKFIDVGGGLDKKTVINTWIGYYDKNKDGKLEYSEFVKTLDLMWGLQSTVRREVYRRRLRDSGVGKR